MLAERLDETVAKLDAQDAVLASLIRAVESLPDKLAKPFAQLDGRLDGMAGRMEGISGRMDGLDDRLGGLHKRLDDLDNRLDRHEMRLDAMPTSVGTPIKREIDGVERHRARAARRQRCAAFDETAEGLRNLLGDTSVGLHRRLEDLAGRPAVDPDRAVHAAARGAARPGSTRVTTRLDALEQGVGARPGRQARQARRGAGRSGRTRATVSTLVARAHQESEQRNAGPARRGHGHVRRAHPRPGRAGAGTPAPAPPRGPARAGRSR